MSDMRNDSDVGYDHTSFGTSADGGDEEVAPPAEESAETVLRRLGMVGTSHALQAAWWSVRRVAPTQAPVLLLGETGTGKELFARAVHQLSRRAAAPLVRVDCSSLTPTLTESELFGHLRGAFTGASNRRAGRIELAHGGTLFLDEIGELPLEQQARLLRVLQEGEFEPLGTARTMKVDIRVIAATHRPLADDVAVGRFRADLFHRLAAFPIQVPALRDRLEDLPALLAHIMTQQATQLGRRFRPPTSTLIEGLQRHTWPGNIRELQNAVQRACIMARGPTLALGDFGLRTEVAERLPPFTAETPLKSAALRTLREIEREHISAVLRHCGGAVEGRGGAAAMLGLAPSTLRFRMRKLAISNLPSPTARSRLFAVPTTPPAIPQPDGWKVPHLLPQPVRVR